MKSNLEKHKYVWMAAVILVMIIAYYAFGGAGDTGQDAEAGLDSASASSPTSKQTSATKTENNSGNNSGQYDYTEASGHIGERAAVSGTIIDTYTSQKGTVFFDFCASYKNCPFSAMISAGTLSKFPDQFSNLDQYKGKKVTVTGVIKSYQGQAEMFIDDPSQLVVN